jgi:hypothetical protein
MNQDLSCVKCRELLQRPLGNFMLTHIACASFENLVINGESLSSSRRDVKVSLPITGIRTKLRTRKLGFPSRVQTRRQAAAFGVRQWNL